MCLVMSNVRAATQWNWEGDTIVHSPIILASRRIPGTGTRYNIDIRQYIANKDNAVVKEAVSEIMKGLSPDEKNIFLSRENGAFDFRVRAITKYISENIAYQPSSRKFDDWLFPEETLAKKSGDCEDRAFLLASLLLASGVSSYVVRLAFGKMYKQTARQSKDHVWVMYKNESGVWMLIEPLLFTHQAKEHASKLRMKEASLPEETFEYVPYFVCNDAHLWRLKNNTIGTAFDDYLKSREFWEEFNPEFAAGVHNHIFDEAFTALSWPDLLWVKGVSVAMDINPVIYDPRDHCDNGYIDEAWDLIDSRIKEVTLEGLAQAGHAAADFYAHSSYGYFARRDENGNIPIYDRNTQGLFAQSPDFGSGGFDLKRFSKNEGRCKVSQEEAIKYWTSKKIISGRFGQTDDRAQGFLEKNLVYIPYVLRSAADFVYRACLPHHNEIAVDGDSKPDYHKLYDDQQFGDAYKLRRDAAVRHIRKLYDKWPGAK